MTSEQQGPAELALMYYGRFVHYQAFFEKKLNFYLLSSDNSYKKPISVVYG